MRRASALVILQGGTAMAIPGKLYEYLAAGRPLLALGEPGEMTQLVQAHRLGVTAPPGDVTEIERALATLLAWSRRPFTPARPSLYDGRLRAAEMAAILERADSRACRLTSCRTPLRTGADVHSGALHVMHVLFSLRMGGTELGVVRVANGLDRSRIKTSICSCKPADAAKDRLSSDVPIFEFDRRDGNDPRLCSSSPGCCAGRSRTSCIHTAGARCARYWPRGSPASVAWCTASTARWKCAGGT